MCGSMGGDNVRCHLLHTHTHPHANTYTITFSPARFQPDSFDVSMTTRFNCELFRCRAIAQLQQQQLMHRRCNTHVYDGAVVIAICLLIKQCTRTRIIGEALRQNVLRTRNDPRCLHRAFNVHLGRIMDAIVAKHAFSAAVHSVRCVRGDVPHCGNN